MKENYIILEADNTTELQLKVRSHLEQGWQCVGGPFTYTWASGHGPIHQMPSDLPRQEAWIYLTFCQAMERRTEKNL